MKIRKGIDGNYYAVYKDEMTAAKWSWLFYNILRCPVSCFGQFNNAYQISGKDAA